MIRIGKESNTFKDNQSEDAEQAEMDLIHDIHTHDSASNEDQEMGWEEFER